MAGLERLCRVRQRHGLDFLWFHYQSSLFLHMHAVMLVCSTHHTATLLQHPVENKGTCRRKGKEGSVAVGQAHQRDDIRHQT